jgi:hypothetical protein
MTERRKRMIKDLRLNWISPRNRRFFLPVKPLSRLFPVVVWGMRRGSGLYSVLQASGAGALPLHDATGKIARRLLLKSEYLEAPVEVPEAI